MPLPRGVKTFIFTVAFVAADRVAEVLELRGVDHVDAREVGAAEELGEEPREVRLFGRRALGPVAAQRALGHLPPVEHLIEERVGLALGVRRGAGLLQRLVQLGDVGANLFGGLSGPGPRPEAERKHEQHRRGREHAGSASRLLPDVDGVRRRGQPRPFDEPQQHGQDDERDASPTTVPTVRSRPSPKIPWWRATMRLPKPPMVVRPFSSTARIVLRGNSAPPLLTPSR